MKYYKFWTSFPGLVCIYTANEKKVSRKITGLKLVAAQREENDVFLTKNRQHKCGGMRQNV